MFGIGKHKSRAEVITDDEGIPWTVPFGGINIVHDPGYFEPIDYPVQTAEEQRRYAGFILEAVQAAHARAELSQDDLE